MSSAGSGQTAEIEAEARRAIHLHALLAERKRHAAELTVLNDLARQLTALRHPNEVLDEVAAQTRRLLGVDVAFIMLADDQGLLRIELVSGSLGSALRGIELLPGVGLGGRVLYDGQPYWSEDYVADPELRHDPDTDAAAGKERIGGILGVPLRMGTGTIGVLVAADRRPRKFSEHEVALLVSLAAHAAVAIHNAELFDQCHRAAEKLQRSNESVRRTVGLHERLTNIVLVGGGLTEVVDAIGEVLSADVLFLDADATVISTNGPTSALAGNVRDLRALASGFSDPGDRRTHTGQAAGTCWASTPIVIAEDLAGCLIALRGQPFDDDGTRFLEAGATVVGLALASDRAVAEAERRAQGEFVTALLGGHTDDTTLRRRATAAGMNLGKVRCVVVLDPGHGDAAAATATAVRLAHDAGGWSANYNGHAVALLPSAALGDVRDRLRSLTADGAVTGGIASTGGTADEVREAYRKASDCTALLTALGRAGTCAVADEVGVYQSLFARSGREELKRFIDTTIGALLSYDCAHQTELTRTLEAYLSRASRHTATAQALHIHANTLYQRLAKIGEILGGTWKDPDFAIEVQFALRLHRLSTALDHPPGRPS
ncbi:helix-turn-helix domain-containing protein [Streptomyces brasiliensis]|uniref:helix-turn-helix domain-containing protein n=1 Tax=Streptomyces brasiliensis TaxID=1954 RepID=UPI00167126A3|nr:GAF domain-containing protein [Streptomyces brasiliensis]